MKTEFENVYLEYVDELNKKNVKDKMSKEELLKKLEETQRINL
ncbi:unknown [Firmicutes bacterium CAG:582]|nr:unknown [Firmicutes bacterium CAG:582]